MGSTAMMDDSSTRHRRRPASAAAATPAAASGSLVQVPSGEDDMEDQHSLKGRKQGQGRKQQEQQQQQQKHQRRQQRRRRRRSQDDETPFLVLVFQVGATLLLVCLALFFMYRRVYPYDPHAAMVEEIVYVVDDDDYDNHGDRGNGGDTTTNKKNNYDNQDYILVPFHDNADNDANTKQQQQQQDKDVSKNRQSSPQQTYTAEDEAKLSLLMKQQKKAMEGAADAAATAATVVAASKEHQSDPSEERIPETLPPLPFFDLSDSAKWDVFGIAAFSVHGKDEDADAVENNHHHHDTTTTNTAPSNSLEKNIVHQLPTEEQQQQQQQYDPEQESFWQVAKELRERFAETYGNENIARMLLDKGMTTFFRGAQPDEGSTEQPPADIVATACRLQQAQLDKRPFRFAFGGYSVTAGRGNRFEQSFPFQMQRLLEKPFSAAKIPDLQVINAAIGGCPAFPYGWCMLNFWGEQPDVVSWDYSMNEAGGVPEGLEAYIRHLLATYSSTPKLIVKDTYLAVQRRDLLGAYANLLKDPVVLHTGPAVKPFLERPERHNPIGFKEWRKFGAPVGSPGQALHHPALKEHELMGWMLAMHFLTALEYLMQMQSSASPLASPLDCSTYLEPMALSTTLPPPVTGSNTTNYEGILFGHSADAVTSTKPEQDQQNWYMNAIHCRTTFQPIQRGDLSELVVSGTIAEDLDVALPKSQMYYNEGWTLDLSEEEKQTKRKLSLYENGLGFIDSKEAYYGIFESPVMQLLLPYEEPQQHQTNHTPHATATATTTTTIRSFPEVGQMAVDWFESVVLCQVNEKRDSNACNMGSDLEIFVGGMNATNSSYIMKDTGTLYLGKPVCIQIPIPQNATLTSHNQLLPGVPSTSGSGDRGSSSTSGAQPESRLLEYDQVGLLVEIKVINPHIAHVRQACSISHVIWEQRGQKDRQQQE